MSPAPESHDAASGSGGADITIHARISDGVHARTTRLPSSAYAANRLCLYQEHMGGCIMSGIIVDGIIELGKVKVRPEDATRAFFVRVTLVCPM